MGIEDLMIGDLVLINGTPSKIQGIDSLDGEVIADGEIYTIAEDRYHSEDNVTGIPITPEILEKNGFFYPPKSSWMKLDNPYRQLYACLHTDGSWWLYPSGDCDKDEKFAEVKFVHELQHALRLCGIEKEIIL